METKTYRRRNFFIEKKFQSKFIIKFCVLVILGSLVSGIMLYFLSWGSTTVTFENLRATVKTTADFLLPVLIQTIIVATVIVGIATIILTLFISHKIAGPLYRFKKELSSVESGDLSRNFNIRKSDQLQELALSMNNMINKLRANLAEIKKQYSSLINSWDKLLSSTISKDKDVAEEMKKALREIKINLDYFRT